MKKMLVSNGEIVEVTNQTRDLGHGKQALVIYQDGSEGWVHVEDLID